MTNKKLNFDSEELVRFNPQKLQAIAGEESIKSSTLCSGLIKTYLQFQESREDLFRKALAQSDSKDLSQLSHTMRIEAEQLGAERLVELFQDLEWQATNASPEALAKLVESVINEMRHLAVELEAVLK